MEPGELAFHGAQAAFSPPAGSVGHQSPDAAAAPHTTTPKFGAKATSKVKATGKRGSRRKGHSVRRTAKHEPHTSKLGMGGMNNGKSRMHHPLRKRGR